MYGTAASASSSFLIPLTLFSNGELIADTTSPIPGLNFFVSNKGSDSNDGKTPATPKLNISSVEDLMSTLPSSTSEISLNLEENSLFREELDLFHSNLHINSFGSENPTRLAKMSGMDIIKEWQPTPTLNNVYQHSLRHSIDLSSPDYSYILVAEIDTILEKTNPISAVRYLLLVSDLAKCSSAPGSYYSPSVLTNPATVYIHPSEGAPGKSKYRYEVTTRNYNINGYNIDNTTYKNLFLQTSGQGYGMLSAGKNTLVKNVLFQGGGTHHTVIKSGQIDSCLFLAGAKGLKDGIAAVFYSAEGTDANNKLTNSIFVNIPSAVYTHTNGTVNHKSLLIENVFLFGDTTTATYGLSANNTDSINVSNCYVEGYPYGWWFGGGTKLSIRNTIFRNTNQSAIFPLTDPNRHGDIFINNVLIKTNGNDYNQNMANGWTAYGIRSPYNNVNVEVSNSIIHGFSTWHELSNAVTTFQIGGNLKAHHNIYICDISDNNSMHVYSADNSGGKGSSTNVSSDNNVFILLHGSKFHWMVNPNINTDQNVVSLSEWQALTGQDKNSILIDLRNNPLGLKAIFVDPDNGNWTLAQTLQADAVRKVSAGMTVPPLFYPKRPTVRVDSALYKAPAGVSTLTGKIQSESESVIQWQSFNEADFASFQIEYSLDGVHYMEAGQVKPNNDNMNHQYEFAYTHLYTDSIFFRLKCIDTDSTIFFNSSVQLKGNFSQVFNIRAYPNPFFQSFTVEHPRRDSGEIGIYDYSGRLLKIVPVLARSSKTTVLLTGFPSGKYFVRWKSGKEVMGASVIK